MPKPRIAQRRIPNAKKTRCPAGHAYKGKNLYVNPSGARCCRQCMRAKDRRRIRCTVTDPRKRRNKINKLRRSQRKRLAA